MPTTVRNKIGFHTGPAGNRTGLNRGGFMERLDQARIPFMIKSVDDYGPCFEGVEYILKSGVPHVIVYRLSTAGQNDGFTYDIPRYDDFPNDPEAAAQKHWEKTLAKLPREFNKEHVWLELINEVDRNRCDWLGQFAAYCAALAVRDGYKITMFGWSSGEPEKEGWATRGMLEYLRLCAQHPDRFAISIHEYSYNKEDIKDGFPYKLGRFKELFAVCDEFGIARPMVHITEWGWEYQSVPPPDRAMEDIRWANKLYGPYPQIQGAAIWYLGRGGEFGSIHNETQQLIAPLTELTLNETFTVELDTPPEPVIILNEPPLPPTEPTPEVPQPDTVSTEAPVTTQPVTEPSPTVSTDQPPPTDTPPISEPPTTTTPTASQSGVSSVKFITDVTIPDYTRLKPGQTFTKTWRVQNNGETTWGSDFRLVFIPNPAKGGQQMASQSSYAFSEVASRATVPPGEIVDISVRMTAPNPGRPDFDFSDWKLQDPSGRVFGDILFALIVVDPNA